MTISIGSTSASVLGTSYSWAYDKAGNRTQQIAGGVTTNYTYNAADRMTAVNSTAVSHDANGEVTADETGGAYTWDVRGRLTSLTRNGVSASFVYDQDDLRLSKTVGGVTTSYLLDGNEVVRETTAGTPTDLLQGPGTDNLLSRGGNWLLHNGLDSTSAVVNGSGASCSLLLCAVWAGDGAGRRSQQPYQFTGREVDETGLMYYRARYYNPGWGRFVSQDPIGFKGGINPYVYCDNNPVKRTDPSGKFALVELLVVIPVESVLGPLIIATVVTVAIVATIEYFASNGKNSTQRVPAGPWLEPPKGQEPKGHTRCAAPAKEPAARIRSIFRRRPDL